MVRGLAQNYLGNRHVARAVIRHGTSDASISTCIVEAVNHEKQEEVKKRKLEDEERAAGEPMWRLKLDAHLARKQLRDGVHLAWKVKIGKTVEFAQPP